MSIGRLVTLKNQTFQEGVVVSRLGKLQILLSKEAGSFHRRFHVGDMKIYSKRLRVDFIGRLSNPTTDPLDLDPHLGNGY